MLNSKESKKINNIEPNSLGAWLAFIRPKTWGVAVAPVLASIALAVSETGQINLKVAIFTLSIAILMQIITNMENDLGYTERKAEIGNRKGLPRATARGWLSIKTARYAIFFTSVLAILNTLFLIYFGGWFFALIGIGSILAAYCYMGGPKPIAYTPFGELTVLIFFGLTAVCGTYYLQTSSLSINALLLGLALGCIASAVLAINNWRDHDHDKSIGRETLAVVLKEKSFTSIFSIMIFLPFFIILFMVFNNFYAWPYLLTTITLPKALKIPKEIKKFKDEELNKTMFSCIKFEVNFSLLFTLGAILNTILKFNLI